MKTIKKSLNALTATILQYVDSNCNKFIFIYCQPVVCNVTQRGQLGHSGYQVGDCREIIIIVKVTKQPCNLCADLQYELCKCHRPHIYFSPIFKGSTPQRPFHLSAYSPGVIICESKCAVCHASRFLPPIRVNTAHQTPPGWTGEIFMSVLTSG